MCVCVCVCAGVCVCRCVRLCVCMCLGMCVLQEPLFAIGSSTLWVGLFNCAGARQGLKVLLSFGPAVLLGHGGHDAVAISGSHGAGHARTAGGHAVAQATF